MRNWIRARDFRGNWRLFSAPDWLWQEILHCWVWLQQTHAGSLSGSNQEEWLLKNTHPHASAWRLVRSGTLGTTQSQCFLNNHWLGLHIELSKWFFHLYLLSFAPHDLCRFGRASITFVYHISGGGIIIVGWTKRFKISRFTVLWLMCPCTQFSWHWSSAGLRNSL